jgi:penicillin-binding protein 1A
MIKRLIILAGVLFILGGLGSYAGYRYVKSTLPQMLTMQDYKPLLLTQVFDRNKKKIGEFYNERRVLVPYDQIPKQVLNAFIAAEDDTFFTHSGVNYFAIFRAFIANLKSGRKAQGASTITQQVARTLLLTNEKSYVRKVREIMLAHQMEESLSKEEILYLYLNQIYFGSGAHGIAMAAETYYRKPVDKLTLSEAAILAGLPKAPSEYSPIRNPQAAKDRQNYVLNRMRDVGFITKEEAQAAKVEPVKVYLRENYEEHAPFFLETVRLLLIPKVGEEKLLNEGLTIETSLDLDKQLAAQASTEANLKDLDKRQGYRGAQANITDPKEVGEFLLKGRNKLIQESNPERIILADGKFQEYGPLDLKYDLSKGLPSYLKIGKTVEGIVSKVDDAMGLVVVKLAEVEGAIDFKTMDWARKPNAEKRSDLDVIKKPSQALKMGDVILVRIKAPKFEKKSVAATKKTGALAGISAGKYIEVELDQIPIVEAGLLSVEQGTGDILAMVGGYDYKRDKFNKAVQAARQTGSSFKTIVYASAFDKGYTASTPILDAPLVYDEGKGPSEDSEGQEESKVWKPVNHGHNYSGDIIFRNAIVKSLNIPTVKIIEDISVPWVADYSRRMGIFSNLNMDFTLALGSSSVTLYEMTKMFAQFAKLGKRVRPWVVHKVLDTQGGVLSEKVSLDERFEKQITELDQKFEERRKKYFEMKQAKKEIDPKKLPDANFFFDDPEQLIHPQTAYLATSLLRAVVDDRDGTGGRAKAIGRDVAGKTGSSSGYFDAWFIGYTPQITTGVWVGFNQEKSIGKGEVGGRAALPIWIDYMKAAHEELPQMTFPIPEGIVFANIDAETGLLASTKSKSVVRQAFLEGTEPSSVKAQKEEETDFYKQDLNE